LESTNTILIFSTFSSSPSRFVPPKVGNSLNSAPEMTKVHTCRGMIEGVRSAGKGKKEERSNKKK
jgi:hypothetical protein